MHITFRVTNAVHGIRPARKVPYERAYANNITMEDDIPSCWFNVYTSDQCILSATSKAFSKLRAIQERHDLDYKFKHGFSEWDFFRRPFYFNSLSRQIDNGPIEIYSEGDFHPINTNDPAVLPTLFPIWKRPWQEKWWINIPVGAILLLILNILSLMFFGYSFLG